MESKHTNIFLDFLSLKEFCEMFGVTERTAWRWQNRRTGPPRVMIGRKIYYRKSSVEAWILQREKEASAA
jgi:predicted DNA-binding transcriptional regulator AlpA